MHQSYRTNCHNISKPGDFLENASQLLRQTSSSKVFWPFFIKCKLFNSSQDGQAAIQKVIDKNGKALFKKLLSKQLRQQGVIWMVLFKLNHDGFESIHAAKDKIDSVMCNLGQLEDDEQALTNKVLS